MIKRPAHHCKDCIHFLPAKEMKWIASHECAATRTRTVIEPVCGTVRHAVNVECCIARREGWRCGPEGKLFESRDAQGMSAGTAETAHQAQGEARQPGPKDAPKRHPEHPITTPQESMK
jgi:hypothetical protein